MLQATAPAWHDHSRGEREALLAAWRERFAEPTKGWDFSSFGDSVETDEPPWSYDDLAREALAGSTSALDMGTGGGEVLLRIVDALPDDTLATEGWAPNLPLATEDSRRTASPWCPTTPSTTNRCRSRTAGSTWC